MLPLTAGFSTTFNSLYRDSIIDTAMMSGPNTSFQFSLSRFRHPHGGGGGTVLQLSILFIEILH